MDHGCRFSWGMHRRDDAGVQRPRSILKSAHADRSSRPGASTQRWAARGW